MIYVSIGPAGLFRRNVEQRPFNGASRRKTSTSTGMQGANAVIHDSYGAIAGIHKYAAGMNVSVDHTRLMYGVQCDGQSGSDDQEVFQRVPVPAIQSKERSVFDNDDGGTVAFE